MKPFRWLAVQALYYAGALMAKTFTDRQAWLYEPYQLVMRTSVDLDTEAWVWSQDGTPWSAE